MRPLTTDTFLNGQVRILQERGGYRYSLDAVLLAYYAGEINAKHVLDLGTGCGIVPIIMAFRNPDTRLFGIEIQPPLASLAIENVRLNQMADRVTILVGDMKSFDTHTIDGPVDLVISNPPFYRAGAGRLNPNDQRAVARHEIMITLPDVISTAARFLQKGGRFLVIYRVDRLCDLIIEMRSNKIEPKQIRLIHPMAGEPAELVLVDGVKGARPGLKVLEPLFIHDAQGKYTDSMEKVF